MAVETMSNERPKTRLRSEVENRVWLPTDFLTVLVVLVMLMVCVRAWLENPTRRADLTLRPTGLRVAVNVADAGTLSLLPGLGPRTAERVVAEREKGGDFADAEDMDRVYRIGPKTIARFRDHISFERPGAPADVEIGSARLD